MSVFTNLRTDILKMYEYKETISQLDLQVPDNIEVQLDNLPLGYPYMPRLCERQGHFLLWLGKKEEDIELYNLAQKTIGGEMWIQPKTPNTFIKGVGMFHIYEDHIVCGSMKYAGYLNSKDATYRRKLLRTMWCETINIFENKDIICPSGTYFDYIHLTINQMTTQKEPYHYQIMTQFGFKKDDSGDYWIRRKESKTGKDWIGLWR